LEDKFCKRVANTAMKGWQLINGLWYIGHRLLIPRMTDIHENLFKIAHDSLGHFGADKLYTSLHDTYYWPNMCRDLEQAYILSCIDCLRNKSPTICPASPLHPLPVPDQCGSSIAMDFIRPLPLDEGYDCILLITDQIGSNVRIILTNTNITAEDLAMIFFNAWYCENRLPADIVCDRDKLFISRFWKALTKLTRVKLKMSTLYHPETDRASEHSNKTINQMLCYHVQRNQKGWVHALPRIHFQIMNTVNASTGFSGFQLHLGRSPRVMPVIVPDILPPDLHDAGETATTLIQKLNNDVAKARDNLLLTKITQAHHASKLRGPDPEYKGDLVMLSTADCRHKYKKKGEKRSAKFFPQWDGPYQITEAYLETSLYTLDIHSNTYPVYHVSHLKPHHANNNELFPS
jgi:Integrase zinc binding domain